MKSTLQATKGKEPMSANQSERYKKDKYMVVALQMIFGTSLLYIWLGEIVLGKKK